MKAITLWRPWAWAIVHGPKRIENRDWKPPAQIVGQRLLIHAGKTYDEESERFIAAIVRAYDRPAPIRRDCMVEGVVGVGTVLGFMAHRDDTGAFGFSTREARVAFDADPLQERWFAGRYGWLLGDVKAFETPIACSGKQGLWDAPIAVENEALGAMR